MVGELLDFTRGRCNARSNIVRCDIKFTLKCFERVATGEGVQELQEGGT
jgi:hypothetical protein